MVLLNCYKCEYTWNYKGTAKHYLTCPQCYYKLKIEKIKKEGLIKLKGYDEEDQLEGTTEFPKGF